jgi:hypothetical protein
MSVQESYSKQDRDCKHCGGAIPFLMQAWKCKYGVFCSTDCYRAFLLQKESDEWAAQRAADVAAGKRPPTSHQVSLGYARMSWADCIDFTFGEPE